MKQLRLRVLWLALVAAGSAGVAPGQTAADVDAVVQRMVGAKMPAAGVAVVRDGTVVLAKGYGSADIEGGIAANENTAFQLASVTKQFTAAAVMMLVEEGTLALDDPVGTYVADVPATWKGVTIRQLMNQVSGIPNYTAYGRLVNDKVYTHAEILALVKDEPHRFEPGTRWEYSNTNYFLLGMIIEKASGKSYPEFMGERIFGPLGMTSTTVNTSGLKIQGAAAGYRLVNGKWEKARLDDPSQPWAAGAIVSTPVDMAKWATAVGEGKLLKKTSWDAAFAPTKLADGKPSNYGFGWQVGKRGETGYVGHGGGIAGFGSFIVRFPAENLSVVVLANTASGASQQLAFEIAGLYLPHVAAVPGAQKTEADTAFASARNRRTGHQQVLSVEIEPQPPHRITRLPYLRRDAEANLIGAAAPAAQSEHARLEELGSYLKRFADADQFSGAAVIAGDGVTPLPRTAAGRP